MNAIERAQQARVYAEHAAELFAAPSHIRAMGPGWYAERLQSGDTPLSNTFRFRLLAVGERREVYCGRWPTVEILSIRQGKVVAQVG